LYIVSQVQVVVLRGYFHQAPTSGKHLKTTCKNSSEDLTHVKKIINPLYQSNVRKR